MSKYQISKALPSDAQSIARFQVDMAAESEGTSLNFDVALKGVTEGLNDVSKGTYIVARNENGGVIASLMLTREWSDWNCSWYWWIQSVYVQPQYRRQGVYRSMYNLVKDMAKEADVACVRLYVDRTNTQGLSTYTALGMKESHYLLFEEDI